MVKEKGKRHSKICEYLGEIFFKEWCGKKGGKEKF